MGSWWQNQLAFAEGFIEKMSDSVDKRVQSAAQPNDREVQETRQARPGHAEPGARPMFHQSGSPPALPMHTSARQHPKSPSWSLPSKNVPPADISPVAQNAPAQLSRGFSGGASDSDGDESWGIADEIAAPASAANAPQKAINNTPAALAAASLPHPTAEANHPTLKSAATAAPFPSKAEHQGAAHPAGADFLTLMGISSTDNSAAVCSAADWGNHPPAGLQATAESTTIESSAVPANAAAAGLDSGSPRGQASWPATPKSSSLLSSPLQKAPFPGHASPKSPLPPVATNTTSTVFPRGAKAQPSSPGPVATASTAGNRQFGAPAAPKSLLKARQDAIPPVRLATDDVREEQRVAVTSSTRSAAVSDLASESRTPAPQRTGQAQSKPLAEKESIVPVSELNTVPSSIEQGNHSSQTKGLQSPKQAVEQHRSSGERHETTAKEVSQTDSGVGSFHATSVPQPRANATGGEWENANRSASHPAAASSGSPVHTNKPVETSTLEMPQAATLSSDVVKLHDRSAAGRPQATSVDNSGFDDDDGMRARTDASSAAVKEVPRVGPDEDASHSKVAGTTRTSYAAGSPQGEVPLDVRAARPPGAAIENARKGAPPASSPHGFQGAAGGPRSSSQTSPRRPPAPAEQKGVAGSPDGLLNKLSRELAVRTVEVERLQKLLEASAKAREAAEDAAARAAAAAEQAEAKAALLKRQRTAEAEAAAKQIKEAEARHAEAKASAAGIVQELRSRLRESQQRAALKADQLVSCEARLTTVEGEAAVALEKARAAEVQEQLELRTRLRECQQGAALKADQLVSCEARLTTVEGEAAAAVKKARAAEALVAELKADAVRAATASAEESQGLLQTLQQEAAQQREAAAAAAAEAESERRAAADARVGAAKRIEELEVALAAAVQEAASSHRAVEEAVEALEAADARAALEKEERGDGAAGLAQALERAAAAEERCRDAEAEVGSLHRRVAELEEAAAAAHTATPRRAQYDADCKLQLAQQLLAERQAQWEATASARAARILALERQLEEARRKLGASSSSTRHQRADGRAGLSYMIDEEVVPIATLGPYKRMSAHRRFGRAVKAFGGTLDSITGQVVGTLRRSPLIRLLAVVYLISIHVYVYFLLGHMQRQSLRHVQTLPHAGSAKNTSNLHVPHL